MEISFLQIQNFKSIENMIIRDIGSALILVGQNSVGKSSVLQAVAAAMGEYRPSASDFNLQKQNIEISISLSLTSRDLELLFQAKKVSSYKRWDSWYRDFCQKLPSFQKDALTFTYISNQNGSIRYHDGFHKNNRYIPQLLPSVYFLDSERNLEKVQHNLLSFTEDDLLNQMRMDCCLFDPMKKCTHCFSCIGLLNRKTPEELNAFETEKLLEYKLYHMNLKDFSDKVNQYFGKNSGYHGEITYDLTSHTGELFQVQGYIRQRNHEDPFPVSQLGEGMRSIYLLSLLEAYMEEEDRLPALLLMEDPEIFLHPQLQKTSSEILYRLSKKCQVIFSTHSPNLLSPFNSRQIRQIVLDEKGLPSLREKTSLSRVLEDLGYSAGDLLGVDFVFIVEGKQDKSRLPLLLEKWTEYLHRTRSGRHLTQVLGQNLETEEDIKEHMEEIKIYIRGHDLYNIFYVPYKKQETDLLRKYIDLAPREDFQDILEAIEKIPFFENRKRT